MDATVPITVVVYARRTTNGAGEPATRLAISASSEGHVQLNLAKTRITAKGCVNSITNAASEALN
jgi:hypothetical protein